MIKTPGTLALAAVSVGLLVLAACQRAEETPIEPTQSVADASEAQANPFFEPWTLPFEFPPFDRIADEHFQPAIEQGMAEQLAEIDAIADNPAPPDFENTIVALEKSGQALARVMRVFSNLAGADSNEARRAIQREMSPKLAAHQDAIRLNPQLFARIAAVHEARQTLGLDTESVRLIERHYRNFVRSGALLDESQKDRLREINAELARLGTQFSQNVLQEVNESAIVVDRVEELAGLSEAEIRSAAEAASERGLEGKYVLTLQNYSNPPQLASLENRAVRERLHKASLERGIRGNEYDNRRIVAEVLQLRAERARMLGFESHAAYVLEEQTAGSIEAVDRMLSGLVPAAVANARREAEDMQAIIDQEDEPFALQSWDWSYYAEKVRRERFDFDDSEIRPYFELDRVLKDGVFYAAERVYGLTFKERGDLPVYHPDVRVFEVFDADGQTLAFFVGDFYARASKRGGAWMNSYQIQSKLLGGRPVVGNHQNIPKPPEGEPTLMTLDEVTTMFHEFGHALHGMFSNVTYPTFAATSVPRDFVEYPSQVNEMWATWPEILANYARHYQTGEPIPQDLLERVIEAGQFNEGFRTTEYLAASILDMCYHRLGADELPEAEQIVEFEGRCLSDAGIAFDPVPPRYRTAYFSHIMGGYSAGYYSYIWSEVLDADSVAWFEEQGGLQRALGDHFRATLLSRGGSEDAMQLYQDFAGREPDVDHLLERRGLKDTQ